MSLPLCKFLLLRCRCYAAMFFIFFFFSADDASYAAAACRLRLFYAPRYDADARLMMRAEPPCRYAIAPCYAMIIFATPRRLITAAMMPRAAHAMIYFHERSSLFATSCAADFLAAKRCCAAAERPCSAAFRCRCRHFLPLMLPFIRFSP